MGKFSGKNKKVESRVETIKRELSEFVGNSNIACVVTTNPCSEVVIRTNDYLTDINITNMQNKAKDLNCAFAIRPSVNEAFKSTGDIDFIFDPIY